MSAPWMVLLFLTIAGSALADPVGTTPPGVHCDEKRVVRDAPAKSPQDGYQYIGLCVWDGRWKRVESSTPMKNMLKYLSRRVGHPLKVDSCYRTRDDQVVTLCKNGCRPFGTKDCTGRVADPALAPSQHTVGIAADVQLPEFAKNPKALCQALREVRNAVNGGRGGIADYGGGDSHIDLLPDWCNWGDCETYFGEGYCKRTKYNVKKAELKKQLLNAKLANSQAVIKQLQRQLADLDKAPPVPKGGT